MDMRKKLFGASRHPHQCGKFSKHILESGKVKWSTAAGDSIYGHEKEASICRDQIRIFESEARAWRNGKKLRLLYILNASWLFKFHWKFNECKEDIPLRCVFLFLLQGTKFVFIWIGSIEIVIGNSGVFQKNMCHTWAYPYCKYVKTGTESKHGRHIKHGCIFRRVVASMYVLCPCLWNQTINLEWWNNVG